MKRVNNSIGFKIWKTMVITIGLFLLAVFVINITVINVFKEELLYKQLKEAFATKFVKESHESTFTENEGIILINHMTVVFSGDAERQLIVDKFTRSSYGDTNGQQVLTAIADQITLKTASDTTGKLNLEHMTYLYYVQWLEDGQIAMIFFAPFNDKNTSLLLLFFLFLVLMGISFFASKIVAKSLTRPIQELEIFAEEIAKRNWTATIPKSDLDEIEMLSRSLANMRDALKIAEERDREFLQSSSHDLKTPVMIIKGYAQSIIDKISPEREQQAAQVILTESNRLERRITQLLRLNTLGHSLEYKERREPIRVDRMLRALINHCSVIAPSIKWELDLKSIEILGDSEGLRIAFENLLDNQMRYAKTNISVSMNTNEIDMTERSKVSIRIENDGNPFSVPDPNLLFDAYKKDAEGKFGLGLAIVRQVVLAHGGKVNAFNTETGVAFVIELPYDELV